MVFLSSDCVVVSSFDNYSAQMLEVEVLMQCQITRMSK